MENKQKKDIFISYKNDGSGNQFANRLCRDLEESGYSVYFNSNEERAHSFPERIKNAVVECKDAAARQISTRHMRCILGRMTTGYITHP